MAYRLARGWCDALALSLRPKASTGHRNANVSSVPALQTIKLLRLGERWRLRTLSGPFALPILGNLPSIIATAGGFTAWRNRVFAKYGRIYKVGTPRASAALLLARSVQGLKRLLRLGLRVRVHLRCRPLHTLCRCTSEATQR